MAERQRATAAGENRPWSTDRGRPGVKASSAALRKIEPRRQLLQVLCRSRCVAVVLRAEPTNHEGHTSSRLELWIEATPVAGGSGHALQNFDLDTLGNTAAAVACRCSQVHQLDPHKLRAEAWQGRPGRPRVLGVSDVSAAL